jgi:hypothetical protein
VNLLSSKNKVRFYSFTTIKGTGILLLVLFCTTLSTERLKVEVVFSPLKTSSNLKVLAHKSSRDSQRDDLTDSEISGTSKYQLLYVLKTSFAASISADRVCTPKFYANRSEGSTTRSSSIYDLRFPRRRSYYRNHGYGKVEEDAAVGANWYVVPLRW